MRRPKARLEGLSTGSPPRVVLRAPELVDSRMTGCLGKGLRVGGLGLVASPPERLLDDF